MIKLNTGKHFQTKRPDEGINWVGGDIEYVKIANVEAVEATDEYGMTQSGFAFDSRPATAKEVEIWTEARRQARAGRSVWELVDTYASDN